MSLENMEIDPTFVEKVLENGLEKRCKNEQ